MNFWFIFITLVFVMVMIWQLYTKEQQRKRDKVKGPLPDHTKWFDFIKRNIDSCRNSEDCLIVREMVTLFDLKFRGKIDMFDFHNKISHLWDYLNDKYTEVQKKEYDQIYHGGGDTEI